jgi:hypothetical protein
MARWARREANSLARVRSARVFRVGQQHDVEIAVADMADQRSLEVGGLGIEVGEGFGDAIGEARNRHADIGGQGATNPA